jgi:hypothetical protein
LLLAWERVWIVLGDSFPTARLPSSSTWVL